MRLATTVLSLFLFIVISCESTPDTGISTNPNFINGKIVYSDNTPIADADVVATNEDDTIATTTDSNGLYSIEVKENTTYSLDISINNQTIAHIDEVSSNSMPEELTFVAEHDSSYYNSLDSDTITNDQIIDSLINEEDEVEESFLTFLTVDNLDDAFIQNNRGYTNSSANDDMNGDDASLIIGNMPNGDENYRFLARINTLDEYIENAYKEVIVTYTILNVPMLSDDDSIFVYRVLKDWDESTVSSNERSSDNPWGTREVGLDDVDASSKPFFKDLASNIIKNNYMHLDITELYNTIADGEDNKGVIVAFAEENRGEDKTISLMSSESNSLPYITYYK